ncbi:MAG: AbrB/MazE/SpoVT family DNA-binding domain-containing protein [Abyssibacter sp.]|uniref:AbrB/MazE/SpoVT family DNA-binding domain-containing protein n=1 Tax=Abyssibacter sp. TaxID=2320200 RepID=UPI002E9A61F1|nr:AbrB/MazE/SpoVT family DNA-binding domain-containing protein [Pseudomonadota bacterium]
MSDATVTSKGQITIPVDIRTSLSLQPGERVEFTTLDDGTVIMRPKNRSLLELEGMLQGAGGRTGKVKAEDMTIGGS